MQLVILIGHITGCTLTVVADNTPEVIVCRFLNGISHDYIINYVIDSNNGRTEQFLFENAKLAK